MFCAQSFGNAKISKAIYYIVFIVVDLKFRFILPKTAKKASYLQIGKQGQTD